ncbi:hypothetical protein KFE26_22750 [Shewanella sp. M16]|uniref:hypothetical protein n=1 Tax=Shewanella sp. M16 TaxID=2830837 RepID=UPI001BAFA14A|nr:hypothetical protein [Shewanella sp. M16]MBS0045072.1 hypothetical protein [Shewanella sp. M16]
MLKSVNNFHCLISGSDLLSSNEDSGLLIRSIKNNQEAKQFILLCFENRFRKLRNVNNVFSEGRCSVPYAVTKENKVVYSNYGEHLGFNKIVDGQELKPYSCQTSLFRQLEYQSLLTSLIIKNPLITSEAVNSVSKGVISFLQSRFSENAKSFSDTLKKNIGHYFWTNGRASFGRISLDSIENIDSDEVQKSLIRVLKTGEIAQILAIHDAVGRKILPFYECDERSKYLSIANTVRQDWFDNAQVRGRKRKQDLGVPCQTVGLLPPGSVADQSVKVQVRHRAIDMFERDEKRMSHPEADDYYDDLDTRNLLFGAGISGTTGTLLQSAEAFGQLHTLELKKQYCAAIAGYLVGGGMHSYHEVMVVAEKIGVPYQAGSSIESLPDLLLKNDEFQKLATEYYDVAVLGATHWRFNQNCLPSHLNTQIKK